MNVRQRESVVKFLYDLAKGILLLTVVSPWVTGQPSWLLILFGSLWGLALFCWAFWLEGETQ